MPVSVRCIGYFCSILHIVILCLTLAIILDRLRQNKLYIFAIKKNIAIRENTTQAIDSTGAILFEMEINTSYNPLQESG